MGLNRYPFVGLPSKSQQSRLLRTGIYVFNAKPRVAPFSVLLLLGEKGSFVQFDL